MSSYLTGLAFLVLLVQTYRAWAYRRAFIHLGYQFQDLYALLKIIEACQPQGEDKWVLPEENE